MKVIRSCADRLVKYLVGVVCCSSFLFEYMRFPHYNKDWNGTSFSFKTSVIFIVVLYWSAFTLFSKLLHFFFHLIQTLCFLRKRVLAVLQEMLALPQTPSSLVSLLTEKLLTLIPDDHRRIQTVSYILHLNQNFFTLKSRLIFSFTHDRGNGHITAFIDSTETEMNEWKWKNKY